MGSGLTAEFAVGARAQAVLAKPARDLEIEQQVTERFREACALVGWHEANRVFDERGLNADETWAGKALVARKVVGEIRSECDE